MEKTVEILYEDPQLVACVKPARVLSESGAAQGKKGMPELLSEQTGHRDFYPVHRLDKDVSGVMVYAKTKQAAGKLSNAFADGSVQKQYLAVVQGNLEEPEGLMNDFLYHDKGKNKTFVVKKKRAGVKEAELAYHVVTTLESTESVPQTLSLVQVELHSGRSHQIRVQFASRKHPLLGDRKYGSKEKCSIALLSRRLTFPHPDTGTLMTMTADFPDCYPWTAFLEEEHHA